MHLSKTESDRIVMDLHGQVQAMARAACRRSKITTHSDVIGSAQEALVQAAQEFDGRGNPLYYIIERVKWAIQDELRAECRKGVTGEHGVTISTVTDCDTAELFVTGDPWADHTIRDAIRNTLARMDPESAKLLTEVCANDRTIKDVGKEMGIKRSWASRRMTAAKEEFARLYADEVQL